jgi:hypothetical protein
MSTSSKFLFLFRNPTGTTGTAPSPEQMQQMYAAWGAWKEKFAAQLTPGERLKPAGAVVKGGTVTDGAFIESKEVIGSYAFVTAASLAQAVEIALACPINDVPGGSVEVREVG